MDRKIIVYGLIIALIFIAGIGKTLSDSSDIDLKKKEKNLVIGLKTKYTYGVTFLLKGEDKI